MKTKTIILAALALVMAGSFVVYSRIRAVEATESSQDLIYTCPQQIGVKPVAVGNWKPAATGLYYFNFSVAQVRADSATKQQEVLCSYGDKFIISQSVPAGYDCTLKSGEGRSVTCEKIDRRRRNEE